MAVNTWSFHQGWGMLLQRYKITIVKLICDHLQCIIYDNSQAAISMKLNTLVSSTTAKLYSIQFCWT